MKVKKVDLHIHSNYSDAKPSIKDILNFVENDTDLDIIAITDHNTIKGAIEAKKIIHSQKMRIKVIIGEEISCQEGHLVGLFLKKEIPGNLPVSETIKLIKKQKGVVIASHPFVETPLKDSKGNHTGGIGLSTILVEKNNIDALETVNGNLIMKFRENSRANFINSNFLFRTTVGGSDSHILASLGKGYTIFVGNTVKDFKKAVLNGNTFAVEKRWEFISVIKYGLFITPEIIGIAKFIIKIKLNELLKKVVKIYSSYFINNISTRTVGFVSESVYSKDKARNNR